MNPEEQAQRQEQMQDHQANLSQAQALTPDFNDRRQYLEEITEAGIDPSTVRMLDNMLSPDFILSNLKDSEIHEIKHLRKITLRKLFAAHPSQESIMRGELRDEVYEGGEPAQALTQQQKIALDQFIRGAFTRLARSRDGFQQEEIGKSLSVSERRSEKDDEGGSF